jgi:hypothetical protein
LPWWPAHRGQASEVSPRCFLQSVMISIGLPIGVWPLVVGRIKMILNVFAARAGPASSAAPTRGRASM